MSQDAGELVLKAGPERLRHLESEAGSLELMAVVMPPGVGLILGIAVNAVGDRLGFPGWGIPVGVLALLVTLFDRLRRVGTSKKRLRIGRGHPGADHLVLRSRGVEVGVLLLEDQASARRATDRGLGLLAIPWSDIARWQIWPDRRIRGPDAIGLPQYRVGKLIPAHHRIVLKDGGPVDVDRRWLDEGNYWDVIQYLEGHLGADQVVDHVGRKD